MSYRCGLVRKFYCFRAYRPRGGGGNYLGTGRLGRQDFFFIFGPIYVFLYSASLPTFCCFFVLFHFGCSHSKVFGKTMVHEFHISYSQIEWYLLLSDRGRVDDFSFLGSSSPFCFLLIEFHSTSSISY